MEQWNRIFTGLVLAGVAAMLVHRSTVALPDDPWFRQAVLECPRPVVVKFGAKWCGPCQSMDQAMKSLKTGFSGRAVFLQIDIDQRPELFARYGSGRGIPQLLVYRDGRVAAQTKGFGGSVQLQEWLSENLRD